MNVNLPERAKAFVALKRLPEPLTWRRGGGSTHSSAAPTSGSLYLLGPSPRRASYPSEASNVLAPPVMASGQFSVTIKLSLESRIMSLEKIC